MPRARRDHRPTMPAASRPGNHDTSSRGNTCRAARLGIGIDHAGVSMWIRMPSGVSSGRSISTRARFSGADGVEPYHRAHLGCHWAVSLKQRNGRRQPVLSDSGVAITGAAARATVHWNLSRPVAGSIVRHLIRRRNARSRDPERTPSRVPGLRQRPHRGHAAAAGYPLPRDQPRRELQVCTTASSITSATPRRGCRSRCTRARRSPSPTATRKSPASRWASCRTRTPDS